RGPSARADYKRVQFALARHPHDDPEKPELIEREYELATWLTAHAAEEPAVHEELEWGSEFSYGGAGPFRCGFLDEVEFTDYDEEPEENIERILPALRATFTDTTARTLRLEDAYGAEVAGVVGDPVAAELRGLSIEYISDDENAEAARAIADSPHLTRLRRLDLEFPIEDADLKRLAKSAHLGGLEELRLDDIGPSGLKVLAAARWFRGLRVLKVSLSSKDALKAIGDLPPMPNLVSLTFTGGITPTAVGVRRFAASESFPRLARLEISYARLMPEMVQALARGGWPLRHLRLQSVEVRKAGAEALAGAAFAESLRVLDLRSCQITVGGVQSLAAAEKLSGLRHLHLGDNPIGVGGLKALTRSRHLRGLRHLDLTGCGSTKAAIDAAGMLQFLSAIDMPDLRHLELDGLPVGVRGARVLAGGAFAGLTRLDLTNCGLKETGARAVVESAHLPDLVALNLTGNNAGKGVSKLASARTLPKLGYCGLYHNRVPSSAVSRLRKRPGMQI
ncbi:MAG: hypothetical protein K2V38_09870, partial [Gemmataceae bacterium]|nr:hypothetical protein [Gemmataceae bacterium]